ncbi:MAG: YggT family protein [Limnochordia bacterium]
MLISLVRLAFDLYRWILIIRIILSWVTISGYHPILRYIYELTEPVLRPVRRWLPAYGGIDFSPIIVFILLNLVQRIVLSLLFALVF